MKRILFAVLGLALVIGSFSCSSDDSTNSTSSQELLTTLASGTWHVTLFKQGDNDQTANFNNYDFTFGEADVLTASNGENTYAGFWSVDDDDSSSDVDLDIDFSAPASFTALSEDWDILERTNTKVRLRHVSGGNGSTDFLTFEKN